MAIFEMIGQATTGLYIPRGKVEDGDCIIGDAMGKVRTDDGGNRPGRVNESPARLALDDLPPVLAAVPDEIANPMRWFGSKQTIVRTGDINQRHTAHTVLKSGWDEVTKRGLGHPILLCHAYMVPRCTAILRKLGAQDVIVPAGLPLEFDPLSDQSWTRSAQAWRRKEPLVIVHHKLVNWI